MFPTHFGTNDAWERSFLRWLGQQPDTRAALPDSLTIGRVSGDGVLRETTQLLCMESPPCDTM